MTIDTTDASREAPRQIEDFQIATVRHAESIIHVFRRALLKASADVAKARQPDAEVFHVEKEDVDQAMRTYFRSFDMEALEEFAGPSPAPADGASEPGAPVRP
jgi:hypothetical protein